MPGQYQNGIIERGWRHDFNIGFFMDNTEVTSRIGIQLQIACENKRR